MPRTRFVVARSQPVVRRIMRAGKVRAGNVRLTVANAVRVVGWDRQTGPPRASGSLTKVAAVPDAVPVVMCTWRRLDRLQRTIDLLYRQDLPVSLHIWNNNAEAREQVDQIVRRAGDLAISVTHSLRNIGGFGRFYLGRDLAEKHPYVILIDDDLTFGETMTRGLLAEARPASISGYWAFTFTSSRDYGARLPAAPGDRVHYCGTGGMITDARVFLEPRVFACPRRFWFVEDLWLSYVADHELGWEVRKSGVAFEMDNDGTDQFVYLWPTKSALLQRLSNSGWQVTARQPSP